jgi:hypothetical protein
MFFICDQAQTYRVMKLPQIDSTNILTRRFFQKWDEICLFLNQLNPENWALIIKFLASTTAKH